MRAYVRTFVCCCFYVGTYISFSLLQVINSSAGAAIREARIGARSRLTKRRASRVHRILLPRCLMCAYECTLSIVSGRVVHAKTNFCILPSIIERRRWTRLFQVGSTFSRGSSLGVCSVSLRTRREFARARALENLRFKFRNTHTHIAKYGPLEISSGVNLIRVLYVVKRTAYVAIYF